MKRLRKIEEKAARKRARAILNSEPEIKPIGDMFGTMKDADAQSAITGAVQGFVANAAEFKERGHFLVPRSIPLIASLHIPPNCPLRGSPLLFPPASAGNIIPPHYEPQLTKPWQPKSGNAS
eukprot:EC833284.1.p1 GENE.EC833284.1~~EC833284.1.p1  ORF type:complete len:129 (+),score=4.97 EC833284.1:22-387(+)